MTLLRLVARSLRYYRGTNLAVVAGVACAVAVLAGAQLVGASIRESLHRIALDRIGGATHAVVADRSFREDLAARLGGPPVLYARATVLAERTGLRARSVAVYGVDARFWRFHGREELSDAVVGEPLAAELGAEVGDAIVVEVEADGDVPRESLFGRKDDTIRGLRLECRRIAERRQLGEFTLRPAPGQVRSVFVPLAALQRALGERGRINVVLLARAESDDLLSKLRAELAGALAPEDVGIRIRAVEAARALSVESPRVLLDDASARHAVETAGRLGMTSIRVFTYLANTIRARERSIPYSVITAVEAAGPFQFVGAAREAGALWLNAWASRELGASAGDPIEVEYYVWLPEGRLETRRAEFRLAATATLGPSDAGPDLAPELPGVSVRDSMRDWDPPFPIDLARIRPQDEEYWKEHRSSPKAFVKLERGAELWRSRYGALTSVRVQVPEPETLRGALERFRAALGERLEPERFGIRVEPVRARALEAARGSTDFGAYFLYFSAFLVGAALLLAALFFRLGVEGRIREIGILRAAGFPEATLRRVFLIEALALAGTGAAAGAALSLGYAELVVAAIRRFWGAALGARDVVFHPSPAPIAVGVAAGIVLAAAAAAATLRSLRRSSPRALLAGELEAPAARRRRTRLLGATAVAAGIAAFPLLAASAARIVPEAAGFFGAGSLLLASLLASMGAALRGRARSALSRSGWAPVLRLGARGARHRPNRSLLSAALIALATFVIVSVESFRRDPDAIGLGPRSGAGGFSLVAESAHPIVADLASPSGLATLSLQESERRALEGSRIVPLRLRAGDDASCLNLFAPQEPRIAGATRHLIDSGRFGFAASLAAGEGERANPWLLLDRPLQDGAVPAIADATTLRYSLHKWLGDEIAVAGPSGAPVRLRFVAALDDTVFQSELIVSESAFTTLFPDETGYRLFLIDAPPDRAAAVARALEEGLAANGLDAMPTRERLAAFRRVENTYISTFQALGGLGLVLGTIGVGTVLLRNVLERRAELALLRAVGYSRGALGWMVVAENAALVVSGLAAGSIGALVAVAPALKARAALPSLGPLAVVLALVLVTGLASSIAAAAAALRAPLLPALRNE